VGDNVLAHGESREVSKTLKAGEINVQKEDAIPLAPKKGCMHYNK
jgi:hypothetical protein